MNSRRVKYTLFTYEVRTFYLVDIKVCLKDKNYFLGCGWYLWVGLGARKDLTKIVQGCVSVSPFPQRGLKVALWCHGISLGQPLHPLSDSHDNHHIHP